MTLPRSVSLVLGVVLGLAFALTARPAQAEIKTQWVDYKHGNVVLHGYLAYDDSISGKRPGVLMVHRRDGMTALTLKNTEAVAKLGYVAFAPDIFGLGKGVAPNGIPEQIVQSGIYNKDRVLMRSRTQAGFDVLINNPMVDTSKVAVIGYCFGGTVAIEMAEAGAPVIGTVTVHGSFRDFDSNAAKNVKGRVLILHGAEDPIAPLTEVNTLIKDFRAAKVRWQLELYSGTEHGFSTPKNAEEERANAQSVSSTARFFKEVFGI